MAEQQHDEQPVYDRWSRRQALSNRGYVLAVLVPVLIAAAGFGVVSLISAGDETAGGVSVRLPVSGWASGAQGGSTPIEGTLQVDSDQCAYLVPLSRGGNEPDQVWPVWPAGYHATLDKGRLSLFDDHGKVVAVDGYHVRMTGGTEPVGNFATEPCLPDSGDVAVVQSDVSVVQ